VHLCRERRRVQPGAEEVGGRGGVAGQRRGVGRGQVREVDVEQSLRVAVQRCWNVGSLSSEALRTTVEVAVSMTREGRPDIGSIRLVGSSGGSDAAAKQAYEAARRAIIRCGTDGFDLPVEKYDQWREIEMTFNPESMRIR
jgi:hypothetical protein